MSAAPQARPEMTAPAARPAEAARGISRSLPGMMDEARAAGLDSLADVLKAARAKAERETGAGRRGETSGLAAYGMHCAIERRDRG